MLLSALLGEEFKYACCQDHVRPVHVPESAHDDPQVGRDGRRIPALLPLQPLRGHWRRPDLRNHRKLLVVDNAVGFTGSQT
jgi:cardiolipin synthase